MNKAMYLRKQYKKFIFFRKYKTYSIFWSKCLEICSFILICKYIYHNINCYQYINLNSKSIILLGIMTSGYTTASSINRDLSLAIQDTSLLKTKQFIRKLVKQLKHPNDDSLTLVRETMNGVATVLRDPNVHPKTKYLSHKIIMYLILLADLDIYEQFLQVVYPILKGNCMYNKNLPVNVRGEDFFKQSKFFTDQSVSVAQKNQIKKYGSLYIIFCLQTIYQLAKWLPYDLEDDTKPTKFSISFEQLLKSGVQFPGQQDFQFYNNYTVEQIERVIRDIQKQYQSILGGNIEGKSNSIGQLKVISNDIHLISQAKKARLSFQKKNPTPHPVSNESRLSSRFDSKIDMQYKNKIFLLQDQKNKLLKQIEIQRNYFQGQLQKQRKNHQQNIFTYEKRITLLQQQLQKARQKVNVLQVRNLNISNNGLMQTQNLTKSKDKIIQQLQNNNRNLQLKINKLQSEIKMLESERKVAANMKASGANNASLMSNQIEKLKKQNKSLKAKLLTQCSEYSQFSTKKSSSRTKNQISQPDSLKFLGYEQARNCFEPFYSNSSSQIKIRLRKAILRQKELLYRDKIIQIGCITKLQNNNSIKLVIVFTNISEKPLFNFSTDFVSREDLVVKLLQNSKNYLQISGQTKCEVLVNINQIDFRCLLCAIRFNLQQQTQKIALIMPISKLKLVQQLVYTPIKKQQKIKKIQKVFQYDRKMMPNLHKFKDYFDQALLQVDRTMHQTYCLKVQFMGTKFYIQCDQIQGQLRIAVKYFQQQEYSKAEKILQELFFLFSKN